MKRLMSGLLVLLLLGAGCSAAYSNAFDFRDDVPLQVRLPGGVKLGRVDIGTGRWVIPPRFEETRRFSTQISKGNDYLDDVVKVKLDGKWGLADNGGALLVAPQYSAICYKGEGLLLTAVGGEGELATGGKWGVLDRHGRVLIPPRFDFIDDFRDGMAQVREDGKHGYIDKSGNLAIPPQYDHTFGFRDGLAVVKMDGRYGYIDKAGTIVIPPQYEYQGLDLFSEGLAAVKVGGKWGYIDKTGTLVIAPQFTSAGNFEGGLAVVRPSRKAGVVDRQGRVVVEPLYDEVELSGSDPIMGVVYENNFKTARCIFLDRTGQPLTPWFDDAWAFQEGIAKVEVDGKFGFIDSSGKMVIEAEYSHASRYCENGIVFVERDGRWGFRAKDGRWLAQPVFGQYSDYIPSHKAVWDKGYLYDGDGNKLDHYVNHMRDGYKHLDARSLDRATASFRAALRLNPGDEAAAYGLQQASEQ